MPICIVPDFNKRFVCIVNRKNPILAAVISSYFNSPSEYLPMFEFPEVRISDTDDGKDAFDEHYIAKSRAKEISVRVYNVLQSLKGCECLILGGLDDNQKSFIKFSGKYNVLEINDVGDAELLLKAKVNKKGQILCNETDVYHGLFLAVQSDSVLKIDKNADNLDYTPDSTEGLVVIEKSDNLSSIIGINYALSINASIAIIEPPESSKKEMKYLIEKWKKTNNDKYFYDLSALIYDSIDHIDFNKYNFATFFTFGVPYSLILKNIIPFTYVHSYLNPDFFIFNNILSEKNNAFFSSLIFSPLEFGLDEETRFVINKFKEKNYYVKELIGKDASVYNIDNHVKEFPYEVLHICSHGGEVDGYSLAEEFKDSAGTTHLVEYDEVVSFAPKKGDEMIEVTSKYIWRKFDGLDWMSQELKAKNYSHQVFVDMQNELNKKKGESRKRKSNIEDSCAIKCSDFNYQAMFNMIAGAHSNPFIFNNTCWSWSEISQSFLSAGARGYIGTLWNVNNDVARRVAEQFYSEAFDKTILSALQNALSNTKAKTDENIYIFWGLHFSTIGAGKDAQESKFHVARKLLNSFYRWRKRLERVQNERTRENINRLVNWNQDQLFQYFFNEALYLISPKK